MAPHRLFKYDVIELLAAVRDRPAIWDRTLEIYKDKVERKNAWDEVCQILDDNYEHMSLEDKKQTIDHVMSKWTNIRDTFVKSVKYRVGRPKKKYLLYERLKFLTKIIPEGEIHGDYTYDDPSSYLKHEIIEESIEGPSSSYTISSRKKKRLVNEEYVPKKSKRQSMQSESSKDSDYDTYDATGDQLDFVEFDTKAESDPRIMNEDEAFFASLLPTVVRYTESQKLDFRIGVLSVMKSLN